MKKLLCTAAIFMVMLSTTVMAKDISVILNGDALRFDQPPVIINDRTMVPMRGIFEALGADINWEQSTKTVTATLEDETLILQVGNYSATKKLSNGRTETYNLDTPAQIVNDRTLVPVRFIAESLGADVDWDSDRNAVIITRKAYIIDTIKSVDLLESNRGFGGSAEYALWSNPLYFLLNDDIYYVNSQSVIKKLNIYTKEETDVIDFNACIERMAGEDDPMSSEDNIYLNGGTIEQLFYDEQKERIIVRAEFKSNNGTIYKNFSVTDGKIEVIMPELKNYTTDFVASLPGNKVINTRGESYDSDTGVWLGETRFSPGETYKGRYMYNKLYYCHSYGYNFYVFENDLNGSDEYIICDRNILSADFSGDFIYALRDNGDIEKYNLSGALKGIIKSSDMAVRDGISKKDGELMIANNADMVLFNGNAFRLIKKN